MTDADKLVEAVANAHIIAAAPDLYAALDNLVSLMDGRAPAWFHDEFADDLNSARAALAKARGET